MTFIGAVIIAVAFLIAILIAISWIISAQQTQFKRPNMVVEKAESLLAGTGIWLEIKNYGIETTRLEKVYIYDPEYGKYYIAYANSTSNNVVDPETGAIVGSMEVKPLSASEGGEIYVKILFNAGVLKGNLITGVAVFDKTLAPWKLYRIRPPVSKPGYAVNAWRIKLFIFNPSDTTVFADNKTRFLPGTPTKLPIAIILINKYTPFAGHFFNWTCGLAQAYGWTPGSDVIFTDAYRKVLLPFYRYYFNCTSRTAVFIVYLKNTTIFPRQTYPIYMWYAPWVAGGGTQITITDHSNETIYYLAVNNSFQTLFKTPPAWNYDNGLRSKIALVRDYTASQQMDPIYDYEGDIEDLNVTSYADWEWDGSDHVYCTQYRTSTTVDYTCSLTYLNLSDGFFERFNVGGSWYYYQYPEGYTWLMEVAFNMTHNPPQLPFNQTYVNAMSTELFYRAGWWFGRWWDAAWYGWIAKTFGATAANWAIIYSQRYIPNIVPPDYYVFKVNNVENIMLVNTSISVNWWGPDRAYVTSTQYIPITPGQSALVKLYYDSGTGYTYLEVQTDQGTYRFTLWANINYGFRVLLINTTGSYIKMFINSWSDDIYFYDYFYPQLGWEGIPSMYVRTYFIYPRYFGVWWIASKYKDTDSTIWVGSEIEATLRSTNLKLLNFSKLHRLVYSYTSGADLIGSQFVWMGIASEGNKIDDNRGNPPPLEFITAEASGAYGDELIEGNTVTLMVVNTCRDRVNGLNYYLVQLDWMRVIIGLGYIWWEGPVLDQWPVTT